MTSTPIVDSDTRLCSTKETVYVIVEMSMSSIKYLFLFKFVYIFIFLIHFLNGKCGDYCLDKK